MSAAPPKDDKKDDKKAQYDQLVASFLGSRKILIVDPASSSRASVMHMLVTLGAKPFQVTQAKTIQEASEEIASKKPGIVVTEYNLDRQCGLDLLQTQRASNPSSKESLFILLTGNTSQSAVARAAEEDVDAFILKPFTPESFRNILIKAAVNKLQPPAYLKKIEEGKAALDKSELDKAEALFNEAKALDAQPALALAYIGHIQKLKTLLEEAKGSFSGGLEFNKIHYKCMTGLFDLLMAQKNYEQAYDVVKRISQYFPANPKRLAEVLRLAIVNKAYEDVEKYYQSFQNLDERNDTLVRYICAALVVCGKYYLNTGNRSRGTELCQKAAVTCAGRTNILAEIVKNLAECKMGNEAKKILERFPLDTHKSADYLNSAFLTEAASGAHAAAINSGRKLIAAGHATERSYQVLVEVLLAAGNLPQAEEAAQQAIAKHPNLGDALKPLLEEARKNAPKAAA